MEKDTLPFGQTGNAALASKEKGEEIYRSIMPALLDLLDQLERRLIE
jgi:creatinine amidohydrolase/Fe(II)-dependent formamide hydrolase-like protein